MVSANELPPIEPGESAEDFHAQALQQTAEDQGVATPFTARFAQTGPGRRPWTDVPSQDKVPHYSHRGGRSYPEPSESDMDPNWSRPVTGRLPADEEHAYLDDGPELGLRGARIASITAGLNTLEKATRGLPKREADIRKLAAAQKAESRARNSTPE